MNKFLHILKILPVILRRVVHVLSHLFCGDDCKDGDFNAQT